MSDAGDQISVETAILALVIRSANDAATAVGEHLGGTESGFAKPDDRQGAARSA